MMVDETEVRQLEDALESEYIARVIQSQFERFADAAAEAHLNGAGDGVREVYESMSEVSAMDLDQFRDWMLDDPETSLELLETLSDFEQQQ